MHVAQKRQKRLYDTKLRQYAFNLGDYVLLLDQSSKVGISRKLRPIWVGPYIISQVLSPILFRIEDKKRSFVVHHDKLKICNDRTFPLWIRRKRQQVLDLDQTLLIPDTDDNIVDESSITNEDFSNISLSESIFPGPDDPNLLPDLDEQSTPVTTRVGRESKKPRYLQDYST